MATRTKGTGQRRKRRGSSRPLLHPERLWRLFKRAGWVARILALVLVLVSLLGVAFLVVPFGVITRHPEPPPLELVVPCPPPVVSAVAGSGGMTNPVPSVPEMADAQDQLCGAFGRQRAVTGVLLLLAGIVNAAAVLEWARTWRRAKRRRRRARRANTSRSPEARAPETRTPETRPTSPDAEPATTSEGAAPTSAEDTEPARD
jgi:hypothetical protein